MRAFGLEPIRKAATRHESSFVAAHVQSYIPRLLASFVALATLFEWARRTFWDDLELALLLGILPSVGNSADFAGRRIASSKYSKYSFVGDSRPARV